MGYQFDNNDNEYKSVINGGTIEDEHIQDCF